MSTTTVSTGTAPVLELRDISKTYPGVTALDGVSVEVKPGRVHAVLGENGAGKSTLVGVAAGSIVPDSGTIGLAGEHYSRIHPRAAHDAGLAIVYQTPALTPSLSVVDCVLELLPEQKRPGRREAAGWLSRHFASLGLSIDPTALVGSLSPREAHLIEIAAALASDPSVLILDEPTEALGADETEWLFQMISDSLERGVGVIYITHRIPEVIEIGHDLTVLRDGRVVGYGLVADFSPDQVVELIVGRSLETTFPVKSRTSSTRPVLSVERLSGARFKDVSMQVLPGQIVGLAGVEGNGQREFLAALAGRGADDGTVRVDDRTLRRYNLRAAAKAGIAYIPGDRLGEAMFAKMSIRENVVAPSLDSAMPRGLVDRQREYRLTRGAIEGLAVKTPTLESPITSLSGGSQQKVLLARARLQSPRVLLVEDPTQGVDAGARVSIYTFLREIANSGVAVVVLSTDAVELEGLCDSVFVFSHGKVQAILTGEEVTERAITSSAVLAVRDRDASEIMSIKPPNKLWTRFRGEAQAGVLLLLCAILMIGARIDSPAFLSSLNLTQLYAAAAVIILVSLGQMLAVMTGGIDLSVGSVIALSGVILTFFANNGIAYFLLGVLLTLAAAAVVGLVNGVLVTRIGMPAVIATLVSYVAVIGVAQVLRATPTGAISTSVTTFVQASVSNVPVTLILAVAITVLVWLGVARTRPGRGLRATGSDAVKANRMGVDVPRARMTALVACAVLSAMAGIALYSTTTTGDPNSGQEYVFTSVTAVVIAGTSIFGGSGSGIAVAAAAFFLATVTNAFTFLSLSVAWQYWIQGALVLLTAAIPIAARELRARAAAARLDTAERAART